MNFKQSIILLFFVVISFSSCEEATKKPETTEARDTALDSLKRDYLSKIQKIEQAVLEDKEEDKTLLLTLINYYRQYEYKIPNDSLIPEMNMKAAQLYAGQFQQFDKAREIYETIYNKYPNWEKHPDMLYLKGFTYFQESDSVRTIRTMEDFIRTFPTHELVKDAKDIIDLTQQGESKFIQKITD